VEFSKILSKYFHNFDVKLKPLSCCTLKSEKCETKSNKEINFTQWKRPRPKLSCGAKERNRRRRRRRK
jgi:hypothetical protein